MFAIKEENSNEMPIGERTNETNTMHLTDINVDIYSNQLNHKSSQHEESHQTPMRKS